MPKSWPFPLNVQFDFEIKCVYILLDNKEMCSHMNVFKKNQIANSTKLGTKLYSPLF